MLLGNTLKSQAEAVESRIERGALQLVNRLDEGPDHGGRDEEPMPGPLASPGHPAVAPQVAHA